MRRADSLRLLVSAIYVRSSAFPGPMTISSSQKMRIRGRTVMRGLSEGIMGERGCGTNLLRVVAEEKPKAGGAGFILGAHAMELSSGVMVG